MAVHYLELDDEPDFDLIGIASHINNYRMCWLLNTCLELRLSKSDTPLIQYHKEEERSEHTVFEGENEYWKTTLHLIQNKASDNHFLLPEKRVADYLLRLKNPKQAYSKEILQKLNSESLVMTAFAIRPSDLKSLNNLIF